MQMQVPNLHCLVLALVKQQTAQDCILQGHLPFIQSYNGCTGENVSGGFLMGYYRANIGDMCNNGLGYSWLNTDGTLLIIKKLKPILSS